MHPRRSLLPRAGASFFTGECEDGVCGRRGGVLRARGDGRRNGRRSTSATPRSAGSAAAEGRQRSGVCPLVGHRHTCQTEGEGAMTTVTTEKEVSPVEDLEKARERRGRLRATRGVTDRALPEADEALTRDLQDWGAPTTSSAGAELSTMVFHQT